MPIFFKPSASDFSLSADSIGNRWLQEPVVRPNGFPLYHWNTSFWILSYGFNRSLIEESWFKVSII